MKEYVEFFGVIQIYGFLIGGARRDSVFSLSILFTVYINSVYGV